jgi:hypothetical protein
MTAGSSSLNHTWACVAVLVLAQLSKWKGGQDAAQWWPRSEGRVPSGNGAGGPTRA